MPPGNNLHPHPPPKSKFDIILSIESVVAPTDNENREMGIKILTPLVTVHFVKIFELTHFQY